ncbi:MAG: hypothetical protein KC503_23705 [Myxococcales bacterium]|nr:hypothetical protein [Myxococcales bacterium]
MRQALHKVLVLWDLGYLREALGQFRQHAEAALTRLCNARAEDLAPQLSRGQTAKVVERLYEERGVLPARVALHLHTMLAWGNYASHHQRRAHHARPSDLALLLGIAVELEGWVAAELGEASIFVEDADHDQSAARVADDSAAQGLDIEVARAFVREAGGAEQVRSAGYKLGAPQLGVELYWRVPARGGEARAAGSSEATPYRGLAPFEPEDAASFIGREALTARVVESVDTKRLTLLSGASGAGKTSLLRAGLVPALLELDAGVLLVSEASARSLRIVDAVLERWGSRALVVIFDQLERALLAEVDADLRRELLAHVLRIGEPRPTFSEAPSEGPPPADRTAMARRVVVSIREDFVGRLLRETRAVDERRAAIVHRGDAFIAVEPLDAEATREAIVRPLQGSGVRFDEALVERLLRELSEERGITPARLQIVCGRLWAAARHAERARIDEALYDELGGAERIFGGYLDEVLATERYDGRLLDADVERRDLARAVLRAMTGSEARRWVDLGALWSTLPPSTRADELELRGVLDQLIADRVVVSRGAPAGTLLYSLVHDQLVSVVRAFTSATELELSQAQELVERGLRAYGEHGELLVGRPLRLVERRVLDMPREQRTRARPLLVASLRARRVRRAGVGLLVLIALAGLSFGVVQLRRAVVQRDRAVAVADEGVLLRARLEMDRDPTLAVAWLRNLARPSSAVGVRTLLEEARRRGVAQVLSGHEALVTACAFVRGGGALLSASRDRTLRLWSLAALGAGARGLGRAPAVWRGHKDFVSAMAVSPDGALVASGSWDNTIRLWSLPGGRTVATLRGHGTWVYGLAFSPDGKVLVSVGVDGLRRWDVARRALIDKTPIRAHAGEVVAVAYSPRGDLFATASLDGSAMVYDAKRGVRLEPALLGHKKSVYGVTFSPDGRLLATASLDGAVRLYDSAARGAPIAELGRHADGALAVAFSPSGRRLASAGADKLVRLYDVARRAPVGPPLRGHLGFVRALAFSPDGKRLASASRDHTLRVWDLAARRGGALRLRGHSQHVQALSFSPDGKRLASASRDGTVRRFSVRKRRARGAPIEHGSAVYALAYAPDGRALASASEDGRVRLFALGSTVLSGGGSTAAAAAAAATPRALTLGRSGSARYCLAFSPDGRRVAAGGEDGTIALYDREAARADGPALIGHSNAVFACSFSPDGKTLASAGRDGTVLLWHARASARRDQARYRLTPALYQSREAIYALRFSPDGRLLASGGGDATIRLFDVAQRAESGRPLTGHRHWVLSVAFSPDGRTLASGSSDATVRLWELSRRRALGAPLRGHTDWVYAVAFSPDGHTLASGSGDRTIWLWQLARSSLSSLRRSIDTLTNLHVGIDGHVAVQGYGLGRRVRSAAP